MTCHLCSESQLQENNKIVWTDISGKEYCILHAPAGQKNIGQKDFNDLIFHIIKKAAADDRWCDLSNTIFPWEITFSKETTGPSIPHIDLSNSTFKKRTAFVDFDTKKRFILDNSIFESSLQLHRVTLGDTSSFTYINCQEDARFRFCNFSETEGFNSAIFYKAVEFLHVVFKDIDFNFATFEETLAIYFTDFLGESSFENTNFKKNVKIIESQFNKATFKSSNFLSDAAFVRSIFLKEVVFMQTIFGGDATFTNCQTATSKLFFYELSATQKITFSRIDLHNAIFLFTDLDKIKFNNVKWQLSPDGARIISPVESNLKGNLDKNLRNIDEEILQDTINFYRQMKKKARDNSDDEEASLWHYSEKEMVLRRLQTYDKRPFHKKILQAYKITSRYGEDPRQAAEVLVYLLLLLLATLALGGLNALGEPPYNVTAAHISNGLRVAAQYALFMKPDWSPPAFFDFIAILLSRLLIPIQAAIFAFALRNKLHR